jgi:hypothetical protein
MNLAYILSGAAPVKKRYKIGNTMTTAVGIPTMVAGAADPGIISLPASAVSAVTDCVGVTLDTGVYSTTQGDAEGMVTVVINPDAVWRAHASGSAAAGVQLNLTTNDVAETAGLVIDKTGATGVGDPDPNSPTMDSGYAFAVSGNNKGQSRKIVTVGATSATVGVPFLNDILSGDEFILVPWEIAGIDDNLVWLTTNLDEVRQNIAAQSVGAIVAVVDLEVDFADVTTARRNSYMHLLFEDHILKDLTH